MPRSDNEKMLGANLPRDYVDDFWERAAPADTAKSQVIKAMADLWLDLPTDIRKNYLYPAPKDGRGSLKRLVLEIVSAQLAAYHSALTPKQRKIVDEKLKETKEKIARM